MLKTAPLSVFCLEWWNAITWKKSLPRILQYVTFSVFTHLLGLIKVDLEWIFVMLVVFLSYLLVAFIRFVNKLKKSGIIEYPNRYPIWGTLWVPAFSIGPIFNVHCCLDCTEVIYGQENLETHLCNEAIQENNLF